MQRAGSCAGGAVRVAGTVALSAAVPVSGVVSGSGSVTVSASVPVPVSGVDSGSGAGAGAATGSGSLGAGEAGGAVEWQFNNNTDSAASAGILVMPARPAANRLVCQACVRPTPASAAPRSD